MRRRKTMKSTVQAKADEKMRSPAPMRCLVQIAILITINLTYVNSYPLIIEAAERHTSCFHYSIPPHEDAHMVVLLLPGSVAPSVEEYYVEQMAEMNKERRRPSDPLAPGFRKDPYGSEGDPMVVDAIEEVIKASDGKSMMTFGIKQPSNPRPLREMNMEYFKPIVTNHVEKFQRARNKNADPYILDGYTVCFDNGGRIRNKIMFDVVLVSELPEEAESNSETNSGMAKEALTPLESQLAISINAANSIISEMRFMEKREHRMRIATESINKRIHMFSYVSVVVLLTVTYLQVVYLKRYFKKKKLM